MSELKRCSKCRQDYSTDNFGRDKSKKDELFIWCKQCRKEHSDKTKEARKKYREENKEKLAKQNQFYYKDNKEYFLKKAKEYREENKENLKHKSKEYREEHKAEIRIKKKEWASTPEGKECYRKAQKKYAEVNSDKIKESRKKYKANKLATDPIFKFKEYFGNIFRYSLKKNKLSKHNKSTFSFLGYTLDELKLHIESQFESWMSWSNQGSYNKNTWNDNVQSTWKWQIDHIIPNSMFNYSSIEDEAFKQCWSLDNLRPLNAKQNWLDGINRRRHFKSK